MRTARYYLAREIYQSSAVVLLALVGLFTLFALIEELDGIGDKFTFSSLLYLELLATPSRLYDLLPIGLLIGAILALAGFAQRQELVILRVSGVSGLRLLATLWLITLPLVVLAFLVSEVVTPTAEIKNSEAQMALLGKSGGGRLHSGYWFKENVAHGNTRIINIKRLQAGGRVEDIALFNLSPRRHLETYVHANSGYFQDGQLVLEEVAETTISPQARTALEEGKAVDQPLTTIDQHANQTITTTLTAERLIARILTPERMSIEALLDTIAHLHETSISAERQKVALWRKFAYPFPPLVVVASAAPIGSMQTPRGGVGGKVFIGILLGVGFFMINQLSLNVGMLTQWPAWITALVPNLIVWSMALATLLIMENRHTIKRLKQKL